MFTQSDIYQIEKKGITVEKVKAQIDHFVSGFSFINLKEPANAKKGLHCFTEKEIAELAAYFDEYYSNYELIKFVPASGAASRMFKTLFEFMMNYTGSSEDIKAFEEDKSLNSPFNFFANIQKFAFYDALKINLKKSYIT